MLHALCFLTVCCHGVTQVGGAVVASPNSTWPWRALSPPLTEGMGKNEASEFKKLTELFGNLVNLVVLDTQVPPVETVQGSPGPSKPSPSEGRSHGHSQHVRARSGKSSARQQQQQQHQDGSAGSGSGSAVTTGDVPPPQQQQSPRRLPPSKPRRR